MTQLKKVLVVCGVLAVLGSAASTPPVAGSGPASSAKPAPQAKVRKPRDGHAERTKVCLALTKTLLNTMDRRRLGHSVKDAEEGGRNDLLREGVSSPIVLDYVPRLVSIVFFLMPEEMLAEPLRSKTALEVFEGCVESRTFLRK